MGQHSIKRYSGGRIIRVSFKDDDRVTAVAYDRAGYAVQMLYWKARVERMKRRFNRIIDRAWWRIHRNKNWLAAVIWLDRHGLL